MVTSVFDTEFPTADQARRLTRSADPVETIEGRIRKAAAIGELEINIQPLHKFLSPEDADKLVTQLESKGYWVLCTFDSTFISWHAPRPAVAPASLTPWWKFW